MISIYFGIFLQTKTLSKLRIKRDFYALIEINNSRYDLNIFLEFLLEL